MKKTPTQPIPSVEQQLAMAMQHAMQYMQKLKFAEAQEIYDQVLARFPKFVPALHMSGVLYAQLGDFKQAVQFLERAAQWDSKDYSLLNNLGNALNKLGRASDALPVFDRALALAPNTHQLHNNRGNALTMLERYDEAIDAYQKALDLQPQYLEALCNQAFALAKADQYVKANEKVDKALALDPNMALAHRVKGAIYVEVGLPKQATDCFFEALRINPNYADAHLGLGLVGLQTSKSALSIKAFERALELNPNLPEAYMLLANSYFVADRYPESLAVVRRFQATGSSHKAVSGALLAAKSGCCDWSDRDVELADVQSRVAAGESAITTFSALSVLDEPALHHRLAQILVAAQHPERTDLEPTGKAMPLDDGRWVIGYFSADFHDHATMRLAAELFESHDRERFKLVAFSFGPQVEDSMRARARAAFEEFIEVNDLSDRQIAELARQKQVAVAVDLKGYTRDSRPNIFAYRAAPIQISYLGYPGTVGATYMDYVLADPVVLPLDQAPNYSEKIIHLPDTYQVNDRARPLPLVAPTRGELGLPEQGFVFACFNNNYKITPEVFAVWMRILSAVPGSVLWLLTYNDLAKDNLCQAAQSAGVDPARLVFAAKASLTEHLARQRRADLFLDTAPYNAHTTTSDALWMGLPVLTCAGQSFAARVAASLLTAAGLPELITSRWSDYEAMAIELAQDSTKLQSYKDRLKQHRMSMPLFDAKRFTRHAEKAYLMAIERSVQGLAPDHLVVQRDD